MSLSNWKKPAALAIALSAGLGQSANANILSHLFNHKLSTPWQDPGNEEDDLIQKSVSQTEEEFEGTYISASPQGAAGTPAAQAGLPKWSYDPGPDLSTPMGKELNELVSSIPYFP